MNTQPPVSFLLRSIVLLAALLLLSPGAALSGGVPNGPGGYDQLIQLFQRYQGLRQGLSPGVRSDFSPAAIAQRRAELLNMQRRMLQMGVSRWPVDQTVDYLTVRAELDQQDFHP